LHIFLVDDSKRSSETETYLFVSLFNVVCVRVYLLKEEKTSLLCTWGGTGFR